MKSIKLVLLACAAAAAVAGCGGGSSTSTATSSSLTLSGTAATGAALANAAVDVKCATGTGSATTGSDGSFTVSVNGGAQPCLLHLKAADGTELHSLAEDGTTVANITPVSEMIVARLAGTAAKDFFNNFDASKITAGTVAEAKQTVVTTLKDAGVDLSDTDPLHTAFKAAHDGTSGDALDGKLDDLKAKLEQAQTTVDTLAQALADNKDASDDSASEVASNLLQPAAASCAALHSGKYRVIAPSETDLAWQARTVLFDAEKLTVTEHDASTITATPATGAACEFLSNSGNTRFFFAKSGIVVVHNSVSGMPNRLSIAFPEQTLGLADLAGTWNAVIFSRASANSTFVLSHGLAAIGADGSMTTTDCMQATSQSGCAAATADGSIAPAASGGGFVWTDAQSSKHKIFAYRAPSGAVVMVVLEANNNGWAVVTKQEALSLPAVGQVSKYWNINVFSNGMPAPVGESSTIVTSVDAATNSFKRKFEADGLVDQFTVNMPYTGVAYRAAGMVQTNQGMIPLAEMISMPLRGTGLSVYGKPATDSTAIFGIRIEKP
jgi:hypothetical protein